MTPNTPVDPQDPQVIRKDLSGKDVADFGKEVGRDSVKQALVWTIGSVLGKGLKWAIDTATKPRSTP